jgi:hypothetical protein
MEGDTAGAAGDGRDGYRVAGPSRRGRAGELLGRVGSLVERGRVG